ncbi:protein ASPARTIC PROTEASE IN GUARD CELL 2-like [Mangifera indica]|uniref:protein ASPARTIC PROTEASE IN GUARD CELL 2-like n=1 Tax=Mangifera indica TaxID=29780 RepID=UPI001CF9BDEF|nr:protein ASPARTIC PROTEASE IN GUARD CELL 2-like [Mangifera indica]
MLISSILDKTNDFHVKVIPIDSIDSAYFSENLTFEERGGNFKYRESSIFHPLSCDHPLCIPKICQQEICHYDVSYPESGTRGWFAHDTFIFSSGTKTSERFPAVFGCGFDDRNISFGDETPNNVTAEIMGLGYGPRSILNQLRQYTGLRFAYCLPSWKEPNRTYTYICFGNNAIFRGDLLSRVQSTRMMLRRSALYYVNMLGISIEGRRLNINPAVFQLNPNGTDGFGMDSGSPQTYLATSTYVTLREEMV